MGKNIKWETRKESRGQIMKGTKIYNGGWSFEELPALIFRKIASILNHQLGRQILSSEVFQELRLPLLKE